MERVNKMANDTEVCACCEGNGVFMRGIQVVKCGACEGKGYIGYDESEEEREIENGKD